MLPVRAYGYPQDTPKGAWVHGHAVGSRSDGSVQFVSDAGPAIRSGFSGSPVLASDSLRLVGLVVSADSDAAVRTGYFIPGADVQAFLDGREPAELSRTSLLRILSALDRGDPVPADALSAYETILTRPAASTLREAVAAYGHAVTRPGRSLAGLRAMGERVRGLLPEGVDMKGDVNE